MSPSKPHPAGRAVETRPTRTLTSVPTRSELAHAIRDTCHLTGTFTLRSGATARDYFDKYRFEGRPDLLTAVAAALAPLVPDDTEVLAGLELGGVPIATALSLHTGLPAAFVRKQAKPYGTRRLAEGADIEGRRTSTCTTTERGTERTRERGFCTSVYAGSGGVLSFSSRAWSRATRCALPCRTT